MAHFVEVEETPLSRAVGLAFDHIETLRIYFDYDGIVCGRVPLEHRRLKAELQEAARTTVKRANIAVGPVFRVSDTTRNTANDLYQNREEIVTSLREAAVAVRAFLTFTGELEDAETDLQLAVGRIEEVERICAAVTPTVLLVQQHIQKLKQSSSGLVRTSFSMSGDAQFVYEDAQNLYEAMKQRRDECFVNGAEKAFAYVDQARLLSSVEPYSSLSSQSDEHTSQEDESRIARLAELSTLLDQIEASALVDGAVDD